MYRAQVCLRRVREDRARSLSGESLRTEPAVEEMKDQPTASVDETPRSRKVLTGVLRGLVPRVRCGNARDCDDRWPRDGVNDTLNGATTMEAPEGVAGAPHLVARNCLRPEPSPKDNKASFGHILPVSALFTSTLNDWFAYLIRRSTLGLTADWTVQTTTLPYAVVSSNRTPVVVKS